MDKAYLKRALGYFIAALLSVALILYIGYHVSRFLRKDVATLPAQETEHTFYTRCDGYIFRREETIGASASGTSAAAVSDGVHVHVGEQVATVYSGSDPVAEANLAALRKQLSLLEDYAATKRGAKDAASVDTRLYSLLTQMKTLVSQNDLAGVCELRAELVAHLNERDVASGASSSGFAELIAAAQSSIEAERAKLGTALASVTAPRSGWYYASADGFERLFDPDILETLTPSAFDALTATAPESVAGTAGKLVLDYKWYLALKLDAADAAKLREGEKCPVSFAYNGGVTLAMTVERIASESGADSELIILSSGELPAGFSFTRCQTVDVTVESASGFEVPRSAVRLVDGVLGVYTFDGVYANFRRIEVLRESEDGYLVKTDTAIMAEEEAAKAATADSGDGTDGTGGAQDTAGTGTSAAPDTSGGSETTAPTGTTGTTGTEAQTEFDPASAPYLAQNDLIVIEGKGLYEGKIIS